MDKSIFPKEMAALRQWVCWRYERDTKSHRQAKVPYDPNTGYKASPTDPNTWGTLEEAQRAKDKFLFSGIGFVFTTESGIIAVDIDKCLINGQPNEVAAAILGKTPPTYIEESPSGTGFHFFYKGKLPDGGHRNSQTGVEMYGTSRYFTMIGKRWNTCADEIAHDNGILEWIHSNFIKPKHETKSKKQPINQSNSASGSSSLTDEQLLERAVKAKDGTQFDSLWRGEWQGKYPSQSEADFALCCKLAFWSNHDIAQMDRLFRQSGLFREKWDVAHYAGGDTYGVTSINNACEATKVTFAPKRPFGQQAHQTQQPQQTPLSVFEQSGAYYRKMSEKVERLTNFIVKPIEILEADDEAQLNCELINTSGKVCSYCFSADDFTTSQKFKKQLNKNSISYCFFGTDKGLEDLKEYIDQMEWKRKKGVKALGIYKHNGNMVFVTHSKTEAAGGVPVDTIIQLERYKDIDSKILEHPFITSEQLLTVSEALLTYNEPAKTVSILAWSAACFVKPYLKRKPIEAKFPHLFLTGVPGTGKSGTLEKVILSIFSRSGITAASQVTPFPLMKESSSSNVIPQAINEFKPITMDKFRVNSLCNHFRDAFDGHEGVRGRADQTTVTYNLLAPIVVAGEQSAQEAAIRERTIELLFTEKDLKDRSHVEAFLHLRNNTHLLSSFGRSLLDTTLRLEADDVSKWYSEGEARYIKEEFPARIISNLSCVYSGLKLVERLCSGFGHSWDYYFPIPLEACGNHLAYAVREYLLDGSNFNKNIIEETFEIMARMRLKLDVDYIFEAAGRHLCFRLEQVYDKYTKYRKDYAIVGEVLSANDFKKQFGKSAYCIKANTTVRMKGSTVKVWKADFEALSQVCNVSGFMEREDAQDKQPEL